MNALTKYIVFFLALGIGNVIYLSKKKTPIPEFPEVWWGPETASKEDTTIRPFKINVPDEVLKDLKVRLNNVRQLKPPLEGVHQNYGINTNLLTEVLDYWRTKYNWREREKFLNQYPQYHTNIQGLKIHFLHVKPQKVPKNVKVLPLLLVHGWPGSIREFYEIIPKLTTVQEGRNFVFELVVPSLPGYGFSDGAVKPGLGVVYIARIFKTLMTRLGHEKYYVQGGDWGAAITSVMGVLYPEQVLGVHANFCFSNKPVTTVKLLAGSLWPSLVVSDDKRHRMYPLSGFFHYFMLETGYMHLHATKPDTVGVALSDSPAGLAGYILEKFSSWTNPEWKNRTDGGLKEKFTYDQLLDNIMIYWVSNSITTSIRLYSEMSNNLPDSIHLDYPSGCAVFKHEIMYQPKNFLTDRYTNLIHHKEYDDGGHFAALEVPDLLAADINEFVNKIENPIQQERK